MTGSADAFNKSSPLNWIYSWGKATCNGANGSSNNPRINGQKTLFSRFSPNDELLV